MNLTDFKISIKICVVHFPLHFMRQRLCSRFLCEAGDAVAQWLGELYSHEAVLLRSNLEPVVLYHFLNLATNPLKHCPIYTETRPARSVH